MCSVQIKEKKLGIRRMPSSWNLDFRQRFWASVKKLLFLMISVFIDGNIIFSNVYCLNYSIYACIHWVFFFFLGGGLKYANELCILPKRPDCNFKQTIVYINYNAKRWDKCFKSFKTIHSTIVKILPYSWLICKLAHYNIIRIGLYNPPMHDQTLNKHDH